ncbi:MAG: hypothetical protein HC896_19070 [Bacteroidales bacterium]|nr:hypothetical protein [Bacteroidales bacterium]
MEKTIDEFVITSGNPIRAKDVPVLQGRIDHINNLDQGGLNTLYKNTITNGKFSSKGGAGLGFMEMAKLIDNKIDFFFTPIDANYSFFNLVLHINTA